MHYNDDLFLSFESIDQVNKFLKTEKQKINK